jgi:deaminated glutathione amidase
MEVSSPTLKVAVCQLTSNDDPKDNLARIMEILTSLEADPPDLVCFPENALYLRLNEGESIPGIEVSDPVVREISRWARAAGAVVHVGSVPLKRGDRLFNSSLVLSADGAVHDNYQKIHLFDVDVEGHKSMRESDVFAHGSDPSVFHVKGWKIGSTICYDLRFSELFLHYAKLEVDAILIPAAFLVPTGKAHWEVLTRARAIECQAYVLAAAQGGTHHGAKGGTRETHGHSVIIDPWGVVLAEADLVQGQGSNGPQKPQVLRAELSQDRIARVRAQIPMKNHRRLLT